MLRSRTWIAWGAPCALLLVHQFAAPRGGEIQLGLPEEWWLRIVWCAAAWVYLAWFARTLWTDHEDATP